MLDGNSLMSLTRKMSLWPALLQQLQIELRFGLNRWTLAAILLVILVSIPILVVLAHLFAGSSETWQHLAATVLPSYFWNSLILVIGVGTIAMVTGVATA